MNDPKEYFATLLLVAAISVLAIIAVMALFISASSL